MNTAAETIGNEIAAKGAISFARFMELALYCPVCGFYEKEGDSLGRGGDFYTSVSVGSLFGELLARQFAEWLEARGTEAGTDQRQIVEAGAHDGRLAQDILTWLRSQRPQLFEQIEYWIVEPSSRRQQWQRDALAGFAPRVRWASRWTEVSTGPRLARGVDAVAGVSGLIFANELLDAMPVRRLGWDAGRQEWFEWGVTIRGGKFEWTRLADAGIVAGLVALPRELRDVLPDGFTTEVCPAAEIWWRDAASALRQGRLLALDYGLDAEEFFTPQRAQGTLRAYRRHRQSGNVLAQPGEQDITAHVNFTAIQQAGEAAGLKTETIVSQAGFLTGIARRAWREGSDSGDWTAGRTRQFHTLTHPEHLGQTFRVLVQSRNLAAQPEGFHCRQNVA